MNETTVSPGYVRTSGWELGPYDDLSNAFVFKRSRPYVLVLDRTGWLALELGTNHPYPEATARFAGIVGRQLPADQAGTLLERTVASLCRHGLIEPGAVAR
jgi:hypothetical protein